MNEDSIEGTRDRHGKQTYHHPQVLQYIPWLLAVLMLILSHSCYPFENFTRTGELEEFHLNINECGYIKRFRTSSRRGAIYGIAGGENRSRSVSECVWYVLVPAGYIVSSYVLFPRNPCVIDAIVTIINNSTVCPKVEYRCSAIKRGKSIALSDANMQTFILYDSLNNPSVSLEFQVHFEAVEESHLNKLLPIVFLSPTSGYVTSYNFEDGEQYPCGTKTSREITAPAGHVMMVSFFELRLDLLTVEEPLNSLDIYKTIETETEILWDTLFLQHKSPTSVVTNIRLYYNEMLNAGIGIKMLFSFHPSSQAPSRLDSGLWDCSVQHYNAFKEHLECNLEQECQGGEDEGPHCPYSSPACNGSVAVGNKCYKYIETKALSWDILDDECEKLGGKVASMKSNEEWNAFSKLFEYGKNHQRVLIGLRMSRRNWPKYYRYTFHWADNTISYETNTTQHFRDDLLRKVCGFYDYVRPLRALLKECATSDAKRVVCEYDALLKTQTQPTSLHVSSIAVYSVWNNANISVSFCLSGHVTHSFLSCDPQSACGATGLPLYCQTISELDISVTTQMFTCDDHLATLPYSLVCDFRKDCLDGSDENFCKHQHTCPEFTCINGQCIPYNNYCDMYADCWDASDEDCTYSYFYKYPEKTRLFPPSIIFFDGQGDFYQEPLAPSVPCPQSHFRCAGESAYCLPVYVRCNGVYDCPSHEDEEDCQIYTCPGFYRCRGSRVCVHGDDVCDGWPQCPQHDDETFCGLRCPDECVCQGLAFVCNRPFQTKRFLELRYLDGTNSGMTLTDVSSNIYLVWLSLAFCRLTSVILVHLQNLRTLDLSDNYITTFDLTSFTLLNNLKELRLAGNPLVNLLNSGFPYLHKNLETVDITRMSITVLDSKTFLNFSSIKVLNISYNQIATITDNGFVYLPNLNTLDMRNNPLEVFPQNILKTARYLRTVYSDNYKLCCSQNLPDSFESGSCFAPADEISSCDDLLRSDVYRVFLWMFCVLCITGNAGGFLLRQLLQKNLSVSGFSVFVTNLSIADFLMGVYLAILGVADETYRSIYLWYDVQWKVSRTCNVAGFLSFMSSEVSAMIICLITIDRFIVLRFPFSKFRFERWSASWACGLAWAVGFTLAAVPLLPFLSHWEFYSQNGICIPLPILRKNFKGRSYSFGVMIIFNMVLFVFIAAGQICIYWSVRGNSMKVNTTKKSNDIIIARRLATVVVSDFLCWFPVGIVSIMAALGIPVPSEVSVAMVIFVLPLNSTLNPFLYTLNLLLEKWSRAEEERMLKKLELNSLSHGKGFNDRLSQSL